MKRKIFSLLIAVILVISSLVCLAGCFGNGKIKITVGMWPDPSSPKDVEMWKKWEEQFEADHPEYDIVGDPYQYTKETAQSRGFTKSLPTVFQTYFTEPEFLISNNFVADITDELKEFGWLDKMDDYMREALTRNGRIYGVPRDGYGLGLFLNLEMLYDAGLIDKDDKGNYVLYNEDGSPKYPTTFDEVREFSQKIVDTFDKTYGIIILSTNKNGGWQFSNMAWNFGCENLQVQDENGKWQANLNDPGAVKALEWIQEMRKDGLVYPTASASYSDWYTKIYQKNVAMAICGSDALMQPVTNSNKFSKDDIAFVPMPTGDGESRSALYGGTPFVFSSSATKEQIRGALMFLKYIGRSPEVDKISVDAMELGHNTAVAKGMPIVPTIKAWKDPVYLAKANELEQNHINVNMDYFKDFFNTIDTMKHNEEPNFCQDMYEELDRALQIVLADDTCFTANCYNELTTANNNFNKNFLSKLN